MIPYAVKNANERNKQIRETLKKFFEKWQNIPFEDDILAEVVVGLDGTPYYLSTKISNDVAVTFGGLNDYGYGNFWKNAKIEDVKSYIDELPQAIQYVIDTLEKEAKYPIPEELQRWMER